MTLNTREQGRLPAQEEAQPVAFASPISPDSFLQRDIEVMQKMYGLSGIDKDATRDLVMLQQNRTLQADDIGSMSSSRRALLQYTAGLAAIPILWALGESVTEEPLSTLTTAQERMKNLLAHFAEQSSEHAKFEITAIPETPGVPQVSGRYIYFDKNHLEAYKKLHPNTAFGCAINGTNRDIAFSYAPDGDFEASNMELVKRTNIVAGQTQGEENYYRMVLDPSDFDDSLENPLSLSYFQDGLKSLPEILLPQTILHSRTLGDTRVDIEIVGKHWLNLGIPFDLVAEETEKFADFVPGKIGPSVLITGQRDDEVIVNSYNTNPHTNTAFFENSAFVVPGDERWKMELMQGVFAIFFDNIDYMMEEQSKFFYDPRMLSYVWSRAIETLDIPPKGIVVPNWPKAIEFTAFNAIFHPGTYDSLYEDIKLHMTPADAASGLATIAKRKELLTTFGNRIVWLESDSLSPDTKPKYDSDQTLYYDSIAYGKTQKGAAQHIISELYSLLYVGSSGSISDISAHFIDIQNTAQLYFSTLSYDPWAPLAENPPYPTIEDTVNELFGRPLRTVIDPERNLSMPQ